MSGELETAALASAGGWLKWKRKHADIPPGTPCANCETPLQGTYCHNCGQLAEDFHRSSWHLFVEAIESLLHLDGRLFNTLPRLIRKPGELTRDYLEGRRAWQVQPFRMFLVILLAVLFVSHLAGKAAGGHGDEVHADGSKGGSQASASSGTAAHDADSDVTVVMPDSPQGRADRAQARARIEADTSMTATQKRAALAALDGDWASFGRSMAQQRDEQAGTGGHAVDAAPNESAAIKSLRAWVDTRVRAINEDPERFALILEIWLHRVAILALPVSALMLSLLFAFNRRFFVFDHLIFSMHSLSFQMLLVTTILLLSMVIGGWAWWLILIMPVHLFVHMKGTYQRSAVGTIARMAALFVMTTVTFSLLALLWLYLGFNDMAAH